MTESDLNRLFSNSAVLMAFIIGILVFFAIWLTITILFCLTLQNTLKAITPRNRRMRPGQVWLMLIPLFDLVWAFICVQNISDSIQAEYHERNIPVEPRPTYNIGLAWAILRCISFIPLLGYLSSLASFICWIIYWLKTSEYKKSIQQLPPADFTDSILFGRHQ